MRSLVLFVVVGLVAVAVCPPPLLPPPDDALIGEEEDPELRGLKGMTDPLSFLSKLSTKCQIEGYHAIKNECNKYVNCRKKGDVPSTRYCPSGKFFDHFKRGCVRSSDAECKNTCPTGTTVIVDPMDSYGYLRCVKGVPMPYTCPSHQKIVEEKKSCSGGGFSKSDNEAY